MEIRWHIRRLRDLELSSQVPFGFLLFVEYKPNSTRSIGGSGSGSGLITMSAVSIHVVNHLDAEYLNFQKIIPELIKPLVNLINQDETKELLINL